MFTRSLYIFIIGILMVACSQQQQKSDSQTAARCLEEAETALANDSIRQGETLLRKAIQLSEASEDWHTNYIAHQRLAEAISQSNPEEALRLMKKALTVYEQHPDDERNYVILLDYAGTYAAQLAFITEGSYDEATDFTNRAYAIAKEKQMKDMMCQTLTSQANIAWAKEDYRQQIDTGDDVHLAYIVQSNLAKIALRRLGATEVEDSVDEAFLQIEDFYYKALEQKDQYYQASLKQEMENQQLEYRSKMYGRTLLIAIIASGIILLAVVLALRYRIRMQEQEKRQLQQEAEHQKTLLHQANEVVTFLQNFILERTEVLKKLNQSGDSLIYLTPHEWSEIERTLNAIDDNRFARIREQYPNMQEDDIRLCILTRLGLSNRTIGNIYCITISAVQHRKLKLKKDVFGESNPEITLEQILNSR